MRSAARLLKRRITGFLFSEGPFRIAGRMLGPSVMARVCVRFIEPDEGAGAPSCLCINRDVFGKDIHQLRARTARAWPAVNQHLLYLCQLAWLPRAFFRQTAFQADLPGLSPRAVVRAERFAQAFVRRARARHGVAAILTANVDYAPDEFVRRAAQRDGMPFLVLHKEHANTDYGHRAFAASLTGYRFHGDAVAVFGPRTKTILVDEGVCPPEQIVVTGPPRFDEWVDLPTTAPRDLAVLFAFSRDDQEGSASFPDVLAAFVAAAEACGADGSRFVVKCRDPYEEAVVTAMAARYGARVSVTSATPVPELLHRAFAAVGFCSLAVTEALLSRATVISPRFGHCQNAIDAQLDDTEPGVRDAVRFPPSARELTDAVVQAAGAELSAEALRARERVVHDFFCAPGPTYSALVDAFVRDGIAGRRDGAVPGVPAAAGAPGAGAVVSR
jgi:hypothetical protein